MVVKLTRRVECHRWHGMHVRFGNVLDHHRNVKVPSSDCFIVRSRHKPPVFIYEGNSINRSKMLIVFLRDLARVHIILWSMSR